MKKILNVFEKIENLIIFITFITMVLASFMQVLNRNFIGAGISWYEELARYCMIYMALLAAEKGLRDGTQISVTLITDMVKGVPAKILKVLPKAIVVIFSMVVFVTSFELLQMQLRSGQVSPGLHVHMFIPYFALTFSFGIITLVQVVMLVLLVMQQFKCKEDDTKKEEAQ